MKNDNQEKVAMAFCTFTRNDFKNYDEQAESVQKYLIQLTQLNPANMGKEIRATLKQQFEMCRNHLRNYKNEKQIAEAEIKLKQEINHYREQERLDIVLSFIGY